MLTVVLARYSVDLAALASRPAPNKSAGCLATTILMAAISIAEGRLLQTDREQLLRNHTAHRINQEFAMLSRSCHLRHKWHLMHEQTPE